MRSTKRHSRPVGDRATVIAGTGTYDTRHSVHLTEKAHELGVDGFLVVTPYYNKPPPRGIVEHVKAIAAVTDKPIVYYNIPARVVNLVSVETLAELAEIPNVVAVKQAWDDLEDARRIVELGLALYAGDDNILLPFLELGGTGGICVHTHIVGPQVKEQLQAVRAGDVERARRIEEELAPAYEILGLTVGPIGIKAALNLLGHDVGGLRLPMVEATDDEKNTIRGCLERLRSAPTCRGLVHCNQVPLARCERSWGESETETVERGSGGGDHVRGRMPRATQHEEADERGVLAPKRQRERRSCPAELTTVIRDQVGA